MSERKQKLLPSTKSFMQMNASVQSLDSTSASGSTNHDVSDASLDLECDFAYSLYLRTIVTNQMIEEKIKNNIEDFFDQLSQQMEVLQDLEDKKGNFEREIRTLEVKAEVKEVYKKLNEIFCEVTKIMDDYNVHSNLTECIRVGEANAGKVYLKNVKPLKSSEEYEQLLSAIKKCVDSLQKLQNVTCYPAEVQLLRDTVKKYHELQEQFTTKRQLFMECHNDFSLNSFKTLSDKFAVIHQ